MVLTSTTGSVDHLPNATLPPFKIFIGYDSREDAAFEVCRHSLLKHSSIPLKISAIKQLDLRAAGLYWRDRGPTESTDFSFTRFLTPYLAGFQGWAMFVDCDFLYTADIADLVTLLDDSYAVMCVHHDYAPTEATKMEDENDSSTFPKAIHYTSGGPWFEMYKDCKFADLWLMGLDEFTKEKLAEN
ncbi:hypothetical protein KSP40_PGU008113 [Platanthera guangdongensis]|uniref:Protein CDI-like n=1 Tax=Platanthera guangdongensis TaxID=2320717 RepID=A0ABR2LN77_9ASPA